MKKPVIAEKPTLGADLFRAAVAFAFVVLSIAFVTVPYALSEIPGDARPATTAAAGARHLG